MSDADRIAALERTVARLEDTVDHLGQFLSNTMRDLDALKTDLADALRDAATRRDLTGGQG